MLLGMRLTRLLVSAVLTIGFGYARSITLAPTDTPALPSWGPLWVNPPNPECVVHDLWFVNDWSNPT